MLKTLKQFAVPIIVCIFIISLMLYVSFNQTQYTAPSSQETRPQCEDSVEDEVPETCYPQVDTV